MAEISHDKPAMRVHLENAKTIAVVGLSGDPGRASYSVSAYMQSHGYRIIPVNPMLRGPVLGESPFARLQDIPAEIKIDIINVFRRSVDMPPVVDQAMHRRAPLFWMQLGIHHAPSSEALVAAGFDVVQDNCIKVEHLRLL